VVLPKSQNEAAGFSLTQLLRGNAKGEVNANFARILQQLGMDVKAMGSNKGADFIDLSSLEAVMRTSLQHSEDETSIEVDTELRKLLEPLNIDAFDAADATDELRILHPQLRQGYSADDLTPIIAEAKAFLKQQITDISKVQGIILDRDALPKTLQGLAVLAEKMGIDVSKMTLETLQTKLPDPSVGDDMLAILKPREKSTEYSTQALVRFKSDYHESEGGVQRVKVPQDTPDKHEALKTLLHEPLPRTKEVARQETLKTPMMPASEASTAPLGTKPLVAASQPPTVPAMPAAVFDGLHEKVRVASSGNTVDTDVLRQLHTSLGGDTSRSSYADDVKSETRTLSIAPVQIAGKETLELKVKDAKQMVAHVATTLKEAVENYKPPFTRITMQLNPAKLGEVDVTMIQRGNNVHINISSNNSAIAILAQHSVELKNQLANNGLSNATMQFNTGGGEQQRQSQHQHNMMEAYEKYANAEGDDAHDIMTSLELIVPRYV